MTQNPVDALKPRKKKTIPTNVFADQATQSSRGLDENWTHVVTCLNELWHSCQIVRNKSGHATARILNLTKVGLLEKIGPNGLWLKTCRPPSVFHNSTYITDFCYEYVGENLSRANSRDFSGDYLSQMVHRNMINSGSGGLQAELFAQMTVACLTGNPVNHFGTMVNASKTICDISLVILPLSTDGEAIDNLIGAADIRPSRMM